MKKKSIIFIIITLCFLLLGCSETKYKLLYPVGKDTHNYFKNGQYQIFRNNNKYDFCIVDSTNIVMTVENEVYKYKEIEDKVYIYGLKGFTILDLPKDELRHFQSNYNVKNYTIYKKEIADLKITYITLTSYNEFSDEEKKIFDRLKNHKWYDFFW